MIVDMALVRRVLGDPPPAAAPRAVKHRWTRRPYLRIFPSQLTVSAIVIILGPPLWLWVVVGVGALAWLYGFLTINWQIRRDRYSPVE